MPRFSVNPSQIQVDNRATQPAFTDGNALTDGVDNFARSLIQAPFAAAQLSDQRQREGQALDRQSHLDQLSELWHNQAHADAQGARNQQQADWLQNFTSTQDQRKFENGRQSQADAVGNAFRFGVVPDHQGPAAPTDQERVLWGAADMGTQQRQQAHDSASIHDLATLFGHPRGGAGYSPAGTGWHNDPQSGKFFRTSNTGHLEVFDPVTGQTQVHEPGTPAAAPPAPAAPPAAAPAAAPAPSSTSWGSMFMPSEGMQGPSAQSALVSGPGASPAAAPAAPASGAKVMPASRLQAIADQLHGGNVQAARAGLAQNGYVIDESH